MANITGFINGYNENLDFMLELEFRLAMIVTSSVVVIVIGVSFLALQRTHHIPQTARFLSSSLLIFDFLGLLIYTFRKLIEDTRYNLMAQLAAMGFNFLAYLNVAIMSVERLLVFQWPNFYLRNVKFSVFKKICLIIWILYEVSWAADVGMCYKLVDESDPESFRIFTAVIQRHVKMVYWTSAFVSCICLIKVSFIIIKQSRKTSVGGRKSTLQNYKSTMVVMVCIVSYMVTIVVSMALTYFITEAYWRRMANDLLIICNCLVDTVAYVLWFKECQMEIYIMFGYIFPRFIKKADKLRVEVFNVMAYDKK